MHNNSNHGNLRMGMNARDIVQFIKVRIRHDQTHT